MAQLLISECRGRALHACVRMQKQSHLYDALSPVLLSPELPVVGLEIASDLDKLSGSYPAATACQRVLCTLDLHSLWEVYAERTCVAARGSNNSKGLSGLAEVLLGRPVDKSVQVCASRACATQTVPLGLAWHSIELMPSPQNSASVCACVQHAHAFSAGASTSIVLDYMDGFFGSGGGRALRGVGMT